MEKTADWKKKEPNELAQIINNLPIKKSLILMGIAALCFYRNRFSLYRKKEVYYDGIVGFSVDTKGTLVLSDKNDNLGFNWEAIQKANSQYEESKQQVFMNGFGHSIYISAISKTKKLCTELKIKVKPVPTFYGEVSNWHIGYKQEFSEDEFLPNLLAVYCGYKSYGDYKVPDNVYNEKQVSLLKKLADSKNLPSFSAKQYFQAINIAANTYFNHFSKDKLKICYITLLFYLEECHFNVNRLLGIETNANTPDKPETPVKPLAKHLERSSTFKTLEFDTSQNLKIKVITPNLLWAASYIDSIVGAIRDNGHEFYYILTKYTKEEATNIKKIREGLKQLPSERLKGKFKLLVTEDNILTLYFKDRKIIEVLENEVSKYSELPEKSYEMLANSQKKGELFVLERSPFFQPYDYAIYENIDFNHPLVHKKEGLYVYGDGGKPCFVTMELSPMFYSQGNSESIYDNFTAIIEPKIAKRILEWFNYTWSLFDEKISPKKSDNRKEFFVIE